jgi:hypothetical protein
LFSNNFGHFINPYTILKKLTEISEITENKFAVVPIGQNSLGVGRVIGDFNNKKIMDLLKEKKMEALITLGGDPFEFIPNFEHTFEYLNFVMSTAFFKGVNCPECLIPSAFSFEKKGTFVSLEEKVVNLGEPIPVVGEALSDGDFISRLILELTGKTVKAKVSSPKVIPFEKDIESKEPSSLTNKKYPFAVVGISLPFHHDKGEITKRVKWNEEEKEPYVFINPEKIKELSLGEEVEIETANSSGIFGIKDCSDLPFDLPLDIIAVPVHCLAGRELFPFAVDRNGFLSPGAEKARIKK